MTRQLLSLPFLTVVVLLSLTSQLPSSDAKRFRFSMPLLWDKIGAATTVRNARGGSTATRKRKGLLARFQSQQPKQQQTTYGPFTSASVSSESLGDVNTSSSPTVAAGGATVAVASDAAVAEAEAAVNDEPLEDYIAITTLVWGDDSALRKKLSQPSFVSRLQSQFTSATSSTTTTSATGTSTSPFPLSPEEEEFFFHPNTQIRGIGSSKSSSTSSTGFTSELYHHQQQQQPSWLGRGLWNKNTAALWKSVSFLSDVVVIVLDSRDPLDPALVQALKSGFQARLKDSALPKGHLMVVLKMDGETDELNTPGIINAWKQRLAVSDLSSLSPKILETIQIVPSTNYQKTLTELTSIVKGGVCRMADTATFPSLLRQVHRAFGGGNKSLLQATSVASAAAEPMKSSSTIEAELAAAAAVAEAEAASPQEEGSNRKSKKSSRKRKKGSSAVSRTASVADVNVPQMFTPPPPPASLESEALIEARIMENAHALFEELQQQLEESWLETAAAAKGSAASAGVPIMPIHFASKANPILAKLEKQLKISGKTKVPATVRATCKVQIGTRLRQLYQQHLQALRDYYGRLYEAMLESSAAGSTASNNNNPEAWREAATRVTERFRKAAADAVPYLAQPGKLLDGIDLESAAALSESGLVADMMEAMVQREEDVMEQALEMQEMELEESMRDSSGSSSSSSGSYMSGAATAVKKQGQKTWQKKLAARVLVFAVNYLQGWLAWQGIKHAALEREQQMPKFPLF